MERKLASIQIISKITPHPNADNLEVAHVLGWQTLVKKGEFKEGDPCVYFEIDSVLPVREEFEFLRKGCYVKKDWVEGFRLRTIKLRQHISQGLACPVSILPPSPHGEYTWERTSDSDLIAEIGEDVTEILGVIKWDPPVPAHLSGKVRGNFPHCIPKTDQERIQNCFSDVKERKATYEVTLKLDGSSMTAYILNDRFGVCSRNLDLEETEDNAFWQMARKMDLENKIRNTYKANVAIQGELIAPTIQNNHENVKQAEFYCFDIWDIDNQVYLTSKHRLTVCEEAGIPHVPVLEFREFDFDTVEDALAYAEGPSMNQPHREGVVFKDTRAPSYHFKIISNEYLLREK